MATRNSRDRNPSPGPVTRRPGTARTRAIAGAVAFALIAAIVAVAARAIGDNSTTIAATGLAPTVAPVTVTTAPADTTPADTTPAETSPTVAAPAPSGTETTVLPVDTTAPIVVPDTGDVGVQPGVEVGGVGATLGLPTTAPIGSATTVAGAVSTTPVASSTPGSASTTLSTAVGANTGCPSIDGTAPRTTRFAAAPPLCIDPRKTYAATVRTSKGSMKFSLDPTTAPQTVNNFVVLARYHFYDGLSFHRIIPGFIAQGGDPLGTGEGGPGYVFGDELPAAGAYKIGSLAMANIDGEANSNGSQFFVIAGSLGVGLEPKYSLFGQLSEGKDVLASLARAGSDDGTPKESVLIQSVTISETDGAAPSVPA